MRCCVPPCARGQALRIAMVSTHHIRTESEGKGKQRRKERERGRKGQGARWARRPRFSRAFSEFFFVIFFSFFVFFAKKKRPRGRRLSVIRHRHRPLCLSLRHRPLVEGLVPPDLNENTVSKTVSKTEKKKRKRKKLISASRSKYFFTPPPSRHRRCSSSRSCCSPCLPKRASAPASRSTRSTC